MAVSDATRPDEIVALMRAGAKDIVPQGELERLPGILQRELTEAAARRSVRDGEARRRETEERHRELIRPRPHEQSLSGTSAPLQGREGRLEITRSLLRLERPWCEPFRALLAHPKIVPYLTELLGPGFRLDHGPVLIGGRGAPSPVEGEGCERLESALRLAGNMKITAIGPDVLLEGDLRDLGSEEGSSSS